MTKKTKKFPWVWLRRFSQLLFLLLFLVLFRLTDYSGSDEIPYAVNIFFRWDPLVAASVMLTARRFIALLLPAGIVIGLTLILGRVFCGWLCPMGTLLDGFSRLFVKGHKQEKRNLGYIKYILLIFILVSSLFGLQLVGYFDPFSILVRGFTVLVDPILNFSAVSFFTFLYKNAPGWVTVVSEPVYSFLKNTLLPYKQSFYTTTLITALITIAIFSLEFVGKRFWCRNLCPLGGLLAVFSRFSLLKRSMRKTCTDCTLCKDDCRMNAFNTSGYLLPEECTLCMDCVGSCPKDFVKFNFKRQKVSPAPLNMTRRKFFGAAAVGIVLPLVTRVNALRYKPNPYLLRPPGAIPEDDFIEKCVRCGECMKVCIKNALQPAFLEDGWHKMFTPKLIPRLGYCEFNCTLCGQVCPTGAIKKLSLEDKHKFVIGKIVFDKNRCLPYAKNTPCIVCEEHCPVYDKAIKFKEVTLLNDKGKEIVLQQPYTVDELCIGCGICETMCPLPGESAVRVISNPENR